MFTFVKHVLHDGLELVGADLHVLMEGGRSCVNQLFSVCVCVFGHTRVRAGTHFPRNLFEDDSELFLLFSLLLRFQQFMLRNERGKP